MAVEIKFLSGKEENLPLKINNGNVYFSITNEDKKEGKIYFDKDGERYAMSSNSTEKMEHSLTIGEYSYNGSEDIIIPIYNGEIKK